jgi:hypothetical protein
MGLARKKPVRFCRLPSFVIFAETRFDFDQLPDLIRYLSEKHVAKSVVLGAKNAAHVEMTIWQNLHSPK